jgi:UDP-glucose 4-epimerase
VSRTCLPGLRLSKVERELLVTAAPVRLGSAAYAPKPMNSLSGQRVLVTGGSGFIGERLCQRALEQGATVHAVSRRRRTSDRVRWERADLTDHDATQDLLRRLRPDVVLHLASEVSGRRDRDLVLPMMQANLVTAVSVMLACADAGCSRLVLAGSMEEPDLGDAQAVAQSPYAVAKWAVVAYARLFRVLYELPVVHLRVFMVYGPGQRDLRKLVPYVTVSLLRGVAPELTSGRRAVDWIYVDDVVDAFLTAAAASGIDGASLDIGSGELVTVRAVVLRLRDLVGGEAQPDFGAIADRELERVRVAERASAAEALGWRPSTPLEEGLQRTVEFYRAHLNGLPSLD